MTQPTVLDVQGMSCPSCMRHITSALTLPGVDHIDVQLRDNLVTVRHDAARAPVSTLVQALADAGYVAAPRAP